MALLHDRKVDCFNWPFSVIDRWTVLGLLLSKGGLFAPSLIESWTVLGLLVSKGGLFWAFSYRKVDCFGPSIIDRWTVLCLLLSKDGLFWAFFYRKVDCFGTFPLSTGELSWHFSVIETWAVLDLLRYRKMDCFGPSLIIEMWIVLVLLLSKDGLFWSFSYRKNRHGGLVVKASAS